MTAQQLRAAIRASPFRQFTIRPGDGRSFDIRHPDFLLLTPGGRTAFACRTDEEFSIVDVMLMTEIEFGATAARVNSFADPRLTPRWKC